MIQVQKGSETIAAIATAPGMGAVAMIRISGPEAFQIVSSIFYSRKGIAIDLSKKKAYTLHFGEIRDDNKLIDEVLIAVFHTPRSYTGEDTIEITSHGSIFIQQQILQLLYRSGARAADPGEFTMKAFFNGKMDLTQAEAVADLIASENSSAHSIALNQMRGTFSNRIQELRKELIAFASLLELELDFAEEDVEFADRKKFLELVSTILKEIHLLIESFSVGNAIKNGIPVVIAGKPNVGKSTLLNAILQDDRAIVSEIAGTTRDTIEDEFTIEGIKFRFIDTAGIRHTDDSIEAIGVARTHQKIKQSAIVLYLFDLHETTLHELEELLQKMKDENEAGKFIIPIGNKVDKENIAAIKHEFEHIPGIIFISAKQLSNLDELREKLVALSGTGKIRAGDTIVSNARHVDALYRSKLSLQKVQEGMASDLPTDLIAVDLKQALSSLGEITGEISTDDLLESIFRNFCIGK